MFSHLSSEFEHFVNKLTGRQSIQQVVVIGKASESSHATKWEIQ